MKKKKKKKTGEDQRKKYIKTAKNKDEKQILGTDQKSITSLFSKYFLTEEVIYELKKIRNRTKNQ